ncbi:MAG: hypothetical protein DBX61_03325 [Clostridiales bacterium]|nr:MAG: hypothetical protein DBX61_03325 [Clostridiales bacterium]
MRIFHSLRLRTRCQSVKIPQKLYISGQKKCSRRNLNMSIVCEIVKDLVPLHLDGTASKMTDSLIRRHIKRCASCREYYKMCSDSKQASSARANQNTNKDDEVVYCPDDGYMLIAKRMEKSMLIERLAFLAAAVTAIFAAVLICRAYWKTDTKKNDRP